jgi:hypothetical protein
MPRYRYVVSWQADDTPNAHTFDGPGCAARAVEEYNARLADPGVSKVRIVKEEWSAGRWVRRATVGCLSAA